MQLRSERDWDRMEVNRGYSDARSSEHTNEIDCGSCGRRYFADVAAYEKYNRALSFDPDNRFVCDACQLIEEEAAHP